MQHHANDSLIVLIVQQQQLLVDHHLENGCSSKVHSESSSPANVCHNEHPFFVGNYHSIMPLIQLLFNLPISEGWNNSSGTENLSIFILRIWTTGIKYQFIIKMHIHQVSSHVESPVPFGFKWHRKSIIPVHFLFLIPTFHLEAEKRQIAQKTNINLLDIKVHWI